MVPAPPTGHPGLSVGYGLSPRISPWHGGMDEQVRMDVTLIVSF